MFGGEIRQLASTFNPMSFSLVHEIEGVERNDGGVIMKSRGVKRTCGGMKEMSSMGTEKTSGLRAYIACECFVSWMGLSSRA
jgi:hypothetical protein